MDLAGMWRCLFGALLVVATLARAQDDDDSLASSFFSGKTTLVHPSWSTYP